MVLVFIGTKMLLIDVYKIPVAWSLGFTVTVLALTMLLSLWIPARTGKGGQRLPVRREEAGPAGGERIEVIRGRWRIARSV